MEIPPELIIKAQTLGGNSWTMVLRLVLPQILPRLITCVRLALGPAWLFLIAAEAIASTEGLGYRIFLVRRYLAMDVILPYVAWITLLAVITDCLLLGFRARVFPWAHPVAAAMSRIVVHAAGEELRRRPRPRASQPHGRGRRVPVARRRQRLRQVDLPAPPARPGAAERRA